MREEFVERLIELFGRSGASELQFNDGDSSLQLTRRAAGQGVAATARAAAAAALPADAAAHAAASAASDAPAHAPLTTVAALPAEPAHPRAQPGIAPARPAGGQPHALVAGLSGMFYRASAPHESPYAAVGDVVEEGQVLGLIEAMKLLNEVEADRAGRIAGFCVGNGDAVEAGMPLVMIEALEGSA